jgi:hypothetical protein
VAARSRIKKSAKKSERKLGRVDEVKSQSREWLKLDDGDSVQGRVVDTGEDFQDAYVHRVPVEGDKGTYHVDVPCLDQEDKGKRCPGCKDDLPRRYKFWTNFILRDPDDSKKDKLVIWGSGITVARRLNKLHARHGLDNRDIIIEREGSGLNDTKYDIDWADEENTPLSRNDQKLIKNKFDLKRYSTPPSYEDFYKAPGDRGDSDEEIGQRALKRDVFGAKKRKRSTRSAKSDGSKKSVRTAKRPTASKSKVTVRRRAR